MQNIDNPSQFLLVLTSHVYLDIHEMESGLILAWMSLGKEYCTH